MIIGNFVVGEEPAIKSDVTLYKQRLGAEQRGAEQRSGATLVDSKTISATNIHLHTTRYI